MADVKEDNEPYPFRGPAAMIRDYKQRAESAERELAEVKAENKRLKDIINNAIFQMKGTALDAAVAKLTALEAHVPAIVFGLEFTISDRSTRTNKRPAERAALAALQAAFPHVKETR